MQVFERVCSLEILREAFRAVKSNKGAPGVDRVSVEDFENNLEQEIVQLKKELESWTYKPKPVKRVEIPKPGGMGVRLLGIPTVRDRVVQASIKIILEPIFDPSFSESSFGFRPNKNQEQAIQKAKEYVNSGNYNETIKEGVIKCMTNIYETKKEEASNIAKNIVKTIEEYRI
jgi:retron-type reverse transcriptase